MDGSDADGDELRHPCPPEAWVRWLHFCSRCGMSAEDLIRAEGERLRPPADPPLDVDVRGRERPRIVLWESQSL